MYSNISHKKSLILSDIDDTLHFAEDKIMRDTWNKLLGPWGIVWNETESTPTGLRMVQEFERPGVGVRPLNVIKHFIQTYGLDPAAANIEELINLGVKQEAVYQVLTSNTHSPEKYIEIWSGILEDARLKITENMVIQDGVKEIPGATDMLRAFKRQGYAIGIITAGSLNYALNVLEQLKLLHPPDEEGNVARDYDVIVSGDMVERSKPHIEALHTMHSLLTAIQGDSVNKIQYEPVAMFGDSVSDAEFAFNAHIPEVFIRTSNYLSLQKMDELQAKLGDRVHFVDTWEGMGPEKLREDRVTGEGLRSARKEY